MAKCRHKQQHMIEKHLQHHRLLQQQQHMHRSLWASCRQQSTASHQGQQPSLLLPLLTRQAPLLRCKQLPWLVSRMVKSTCKGQTDHP